MTAAHTASLLDRFTSKGKLVIRAQTHNGQIVEMTVPEHAHEKAASIWGGQTVRYEYRGGRAFFTGDVNDRPALDD